MTLTLVSGADLIEVPRAPRPLTFSGYAFVSTMTINALDEKAIFAGKVVWSDQGSHTVSNGGGKIGWRTGAVTWATAGSTIRVGIQNIDTAAGPPARGDGTFDTYKDLVQGTDTIAANTSYETAMATGSGLTLAHGDNVAIMFDFTAFPGADSVVVNTINSSSLWSNVVSSVLYTGSYAGSLVTPVTYIVADDGTYGTLLGSYPGLHTTATAVDWSNASATKEYGNLFSLPVNCKIAGFWVWVGVATAIDGDVTFHLYSDPSGTSVTSVASVTHDGRHYGATNGASLSYFPLATPYSYTAGTLLAMAIQPTSTNSIRTYYSEVGFASAWGLHGLGTQCYSVSRNTVAAGTSFATYGSTARRIQMGLLISHFDDGAGGGGGSGGGSVFSSIGGVIT